MITKIGGEIQFFFMSRFIQYLLHNKKNYKKIWWFSFHIKIPFLTRMMQNWTIKILQKLRWLEISQKYEKKFNGYVYIE
jgi:hypothetical protein